MATKVNQKDLLELLPTNISKSPELSIQAKKVLGALLHWALNSQASETGRIIIDNASLCTIASISKSTLMKALNDLKSYSLIERLAGHKREANKENKASEYFINWKNLEQPLKQALFQDRFVKFFQEQSTVDKSSIDKISLDKNRIDKYRIEEDSLDKNRKEEFIKEKFIEEIEKENDLNSNNFNLKEKENDMENIIKKLDYTKKLEEVKTIQECKTLAREVYEQLQSLELQEPLLAEVKNRLHQDWVKRLDELQTLEEKKKEIEPPTVEEKPLTLEVVLEKLEIIPMFEKVKTIAELKAKVGELLKTIPTLNLSHQLEVQVRNHIAYSVLPKCYEKVKALEALEERQRLESISVKVA